MRHAAAYLMLVLGGNASPSAADVKKVLAAAGVEADDTQVDLLISNMEGKDLEQLLTDGLAKLVNVGGGGGGGGAGAAGGAAEAAAEAEPEPESEEESAGGAGGLFDDDEDDW
eukprot:537512_1